MEKMRIEKLITEYDTCIEYIEKSCRKENETAIKDIAIGALKSKVGRRIKNSNGEISKLEMIELEKEIYRIRAKVHIELAELYNRT